VVRRLDIRHQGKNGISGLVVKRGFAGRANTRFNQPDGTHKREGGQTKDDRNGIANQPHKSTAVPGPLTKAA
jgi:hypothetical protein